MNTRSKSVTMISPAVSISKTVSLSKVVSLKHVRSVVIDDFITTLKTLLLVLENTCDQTTKVIVATTLYQCIYMNLPIVYEELTVHCTGEPLWLVIFNKICECKQDKRLKKFNDVDPIIYNKLFEVSDNVLGILFPKIKVYKSKALYRVTNSKYVSELKKARKYIRNGVHLMNDRMKLRSSA